MSDHPSSEEYTPSNGSLDAPPTSTPPTSHPSPPQPFVRPPPSETFDPATGFMEAYDCAKLNNNWNKVSSSLMIHPDWLTKIPEHRRWTMLHQIVYSGNVEHLNEVLALQLKNPNFSLLCKTRDGKTVREVANERQHIHPAMVRRIERLVAVDQLLNNAKDGKWDLVKQFISLQPDIVNEKPPYRYHYLAHFLASKGELEKFKDLSKICHFKLDLLADGKTVAQVARDTGHTEFAEHVESLPVVTSTVSESSNDHTASASASSSKLPSHATTGKHYSPGFYDDICISFIPPNTNFSSLFPSANSGSHGYGHHSYHAASSNPVYSTHSLFQVGHTTTMNTMPDTSEELFDEDSTSSAPPKPYVPSVSDAEQAEYEKSIMQNVTLMSQENLLNSITCCITKSILRDPVVAADGFTYEREAIENWFKHSNRSPMTNQELENLELKPNFAIKSILQILQNNNSALAKSDNK